MDERSIERILSSYEKLIAPRAGDMAVGFYERLFAACPEARALFKHDMTMQRQHLIATLALLIRNLRFQDMLEEAVMDLGAHHVKVGVRPEQYPIVRDALLDAIGHTLGAQWTPQLKSDWLALLDHITALMLKGATLFALAEVSRLRESPGRNS